MRWLAILVVVFSPALARADARPDGGTPAADKAPGTAPDKAPEAPGGSTLERFEDGKRIDGSDPGGFISFTFDDGPNYRTTPAILDALDQYGIKATFFVCGYRFGGKGDVAQKNLAVLRDIIKRGHVVANHTWNHPVLPQQKSPKIASEVDRNAALIQQETGFYPRLFRPPYGSLSPRVSKLLAERRLTTVLWNIDGADTIKPFSTVKVHKVATREILKANGGVLLLHDTHPWTAKAVPLVLADLQKENCSRLARGEKPIEVVTLDHFYRPREGEAPPIPPDALAMTQTWRSKLEEACKATAPETPTTGTSAKSP
jgi:peptidoglycan/xylan/chitin deacetylase (PgdA/CDA1 family)